MKPSLEIDPNRRIEEMFPRPKSRFWRRLRARYIVYVEVAGYLFVAAMLAALFYLAFITHEVTIAAKDSGKVPFLPRITPLTMGEPPLRLDTLAAPGSLVPAGQNLLVLHREKGRDTLRAPEPGRFYFRDGGPVLVDFSRLEAQVRFDDKNSFHKVKPGSRVYIAPRREAGGRLNVEVDDSGRNRSLSLGKVPSHWMAEVDSLLRGRPATGRDNERQYAAFTLTALKDIEVQGVFSRGEASSAGAGAAPSADPGAALPGASAFAVDGLEGLTLTGEVSEGAYVLVLEMAGTLPDTVLGLLRRDLAPLAGGVLGGGKDPVGLGDLRKVTAKAKVEARLDGGRDPLAAALPAGLENSAVAEKRFEGRVIVENVPEAVGEASREAFEQGKNLIGTVKCVVDRKSWAARLFSKN